MRTLLLDSDIIAYAGASRGEVRVDWDGDGSKDQIPEDIDAIQSRLDDEIAALITRMRADAVIVCLSCDRKDNFRKDVYPLYKENRANAVKPLHLITAKQYLAKAYPSYERPRLEADDIMGILSTHPSLVKGERIIVSEDKDMQTIPGLLFNPRKDKKVRTITPVEAHRFFMYQTLAGDPTDGYPGCPGIGPVKAERILDGFEPVAMWFAVVATYIARGLTEEDALVQARCARILRASDYDFKRKEPILWTPQS